jgi:hypothetical protein
VARRPGILVHGPVSHQRQTPLWGGLPNKRMVGSGTGAVPRGRPFQVVPANEVRASPTSRASSHLIRGYSPDVAASQSRDRATPWPHVPAPLDAAHFRERP